MSNTEDSQRVPVTVYVTEQEREYLNVQADKLGLRRPSLLYFLLKRLTSDFKRELRVDVDTDAELEVSNA